MKLSTEQSRALFWLVSKAGSTSDTSSASVFRSEVWDQLSRMGLIRTSYTPYTHITATTSGIDIVLGSGVN